MRRSLIGSKYLDILVGLVWEVLGDAAKHVTGDGLAEFLSLASLSVRSRFPVPA